MLSLTCVDALPTACFSPVDLPLIASNYQQLTPANDLCQNGSREVVTRLGFRSLPFPLAGKPIEWKREPATSPVRADCFPLAGKPIEWKLELRILKSL